MTLIKHKLSEEQAQIIARDQSLEVEKALRLEVQVKLDELLAEKKLVSEK